MGRKSAAKEELELERIKIIHAQQKSLAKSLKAPPGIRKSKFQPGRERAQKDLAILIKLGKPRASFREIGAIIGEPKSTVKRWFKEDPYTREQYEFFIEHVRDGTVKLLEMASVEAAATQITLMRFGSEKYMFDAAKDILDRVGVAKVTKQQIESESTRKHEWSDRDALVDEVRQLPPENQEDALALIERLEEVLARKAKDVDISDDELDAIINGEDEEEEDEDSDS